MRRSLRTWSHYAPPPLRTLRTGKVPGGKLISCTLSLGKMGVCRAFHTLFFKRPVRRNLQSLLAPLRCEIHLAPSHHNRFLIRGISDGTADSVAFVVNPQNTNGAPRSSGFIKIPSSPAGRSYLIPFYFNLQPSSDVHHTWLYSPVVPCHTITSFFFVLILFHGTPSKCACQSGGPLSQYPLALRQAAAWQFYPLVLSVGISLENSFLRKSGQKKSGFSIEKPLKRTSHLIGQSIYPDSLQVQHSEMSWKNYFPVRARFHNTKKQGKTRIKPRLFSREVSWWGTPFYPLHPVSSRLVRSKKCRFHEVFLTFWIP